MCLLQTWYALPTLPQAHNNQRKGHTGLGQSTRALKIEGGNWEGSRKTFAEDDDVQCADERAVEHPAAAAAADTGRKGKKKKKREGEREEGQEQEKGEGGMEEGKKKAKKKKAKNEAKVMDGELDVKQCSRGAQSAAGAAQQKGMSDQKGKDKASEKREKRNDEQAKGSGVTGSSPAALKLARAIIREVGHVSMAFTLASLKNLRILCCQTLS